MEEQSVTYRCASCGEINETVVDLTAGERQSYTEDCTICCRPNLLRIQVSRDAPPTIEITAEFDE